MTRVRTSLRVTAPLLTALAILGGLALASPWSSLANPLGTVDASQPAGGTRTSEGRQVTIAVTWPGEGAELAFLVVMDTHTLNLDRYDLLELAALRTDDGVELRPIAWDAPLGSHHREGTLTFPPTGDDGNWLLNADTHRLELVIRGVASVAERVFSWEIDSALQM